MKKILFTFLTVLLVVTLVACEPGVEPTPSGSGEPTAVETVVPSGSGEPTQGETVVPSGSGEPTQGETVVPSGSGEPTQGGTVTEPTVIEPSAVPTLVPSPLPSFEAPLAQGWYDYKFASADTRHTFFAAAERWLLENAYAGIPLAAQSGLTLQHARIVLPVEDYIPSFGWGTSYATLTMDDAEVAAQNGNVLDLLNTPAVAGNYTLRTWVQQEPDTLNYYQGKSSTESEYGSYINGSFYSTALNDTATGWQFVPSLASGEPIPINGVEINGKMTSRVWEIPLRDNLRWAYNEGTDISSFTEEDHVLNAHDFIYSYRLALDNEWFRANQGGGDFISTGIKGAEAYAAAVASEASQTELDALWEEFGITASEDGLTIRAEFLNAQSLFDMQYSFGMPPVHKAIYEMAPELYGTDPQHVASSGLFRITYWETKVGSRYEKVSTHPRAESISWTHESLKILEGTSAQDTAFLAFKIGLLDSVGVPNSEVENYKEDPRVLRTPGAQVWSLNINMVGSPTAQQAQWPGSTYQPVPILGKKDFRLALYFSLNRDQMVQYDAKTYPTSMKISQAYYVEPESGVPYRMTEQGMAVGENLAYSTNGYDPAAAQVLFKKAVAEEIAANRLKPGTAQNYTEIVLNVLTFDADSGAAIADNWINFARDGFETLVDDENFVKVVLNYERIPGGQIYDRIEVGEYDLALSVIQGSTLNAASFLEIFCTDNRSGFLLNYGYDSSSPEIEVRWTEDGVEHFERFSFDAIYEILNYRTFIKDGNKATKFGSVEEVVEIFLGNSLFTEVSRSLEEGQTLMDLVMSDHLTEADEVIPVVVVVEGDEEGEEIRYLLVIERTGNIYEIAVSRVVNYESELDAILDPIEAGLKAPVKSEVDAEDLDDLIAWFEIDVDAYDNVLGYYFTYGAERLLVVIGEVELGEGESLYFLLSEEELEIATPEAIEDHAQALVGEYGYVAYNLQEVLTDEGLAEGGGYLANSYGIEAFEDIPSIFTGDVSVDWVHVYEFDSDAEGTKRANGDYFLLYVIVAGNIVFTYWL